MSKLHKHINEDKYDWDVDNPTEEQIYHHYKDRPKTIAVCEYCGKKTKRVKYDIKKDNLCDECKQKYHR